MNMHVKTGSFFLIVLLLSAPGCGGDKKTVVTEKPVRKTEIVSEINIPTAGDSVKSFFDEDVEELVLIDTIGTDVQKIAKADADDFSWVEETSNSGFKTVYFDFDHYSVRADQQAAVDRDIALVQEMLAKGDNVTVVIEGHACHSAGSRAYNLALSEKRAKVLSDRLVEAGVPAHNIKVVARGSDVPAHDNSGKVVTGDRDQQWANRRDEINIINA